MSIVLMGDVMEFGASAWADGALGFVSWIIGLLSTALIGVVRRFLELRAKYPELLSPQTLFGLIGTGSGGRAARLGSSGTSNE